MSPEVERRLEGLALLETAVADWVCAGITCTWIPVVADGATWVDETLESVIVGVNVVME